MPCLLRSRLFGAAALLTASCLPATNPYDPSTPAELQARGSIQGRIVLDDPTASAAVSETRLNALGVLLTSVPTSEDDEPILTRITCAEQLSCDAETATATFHLPDLVPGTYRLAVESPPTGLLDPTVGRSIVITLFAGEAYTEPDLVFTAPTFVPGATGSGVIRGRVDMAGLAGAPEVIAYQIVGTTLAERKRSPALADGSFTLDELPPGDYAIQGQAAGYTPDYAIASGLVDDEVVLEDDLVLFEGTAVVNPDLQQTYGAYYTNGDVAPVQVLAFGGMTEMRVWTGSTPGDFVPYSASTSVPLPEVDGPVAIKAQFKRTTEQGVDLITDVFVGEVIRDTVPPDLIDAFVVGRTPASDGQVYSTTPGETISVDIAANDATTALYGVALVESPDGSPPDPATVALPDLFAPTGYVEVQDTEALSEGDGVKTFFVVVRDRAENRTVSEPITVVLDTLAPVLGDAGLGIAPISVDEATAEETLRTRTATVRVPLLAGVTDVAAVAVGQSPLAGNAPRTVYGPGDTYAETSSVPVVGAHGDTVAFTARVWDFAGNVTEVSTLELDLDLTGTVTGVALLDEVAASSPVHGGTSVSLFAAGKDPSVDPADSTTTTNPDGTFALTGVLEGTNYRVRYLRAGADTVDGLVSEVVAGQTVTLPTVILAVARGNIRGAFQKQDVDDAGGHGGILVEALLDGAVYAVTLTEADGSYRFPYPGLPVTVGNDQRYTLRASASGYLPATQSAIEVVSDTDTVVDDDGTGAPTPTLLLPETGDFSLCAASGPCTPLTYTNQTSVRIAIPGDDSDITDVRYRARTSFVDTDVDPPWAGDYTPGMDLVVDISGADGAVEVFLQIERAGLAGPVLRATLIKDTQAPVVGTVTLATGSAASLTGFTNAVTVNVVVTSNAGGANTAPLQQHRLVVADADPGPLPGTTTACALAGCTVTLPDTAGLVDEKTWTVWAYTCDQAGNCSTAAGSGRVVYDRTPPSLANGAGFDAAGELIHVYAGTTWSGARDYLLALALGTAATGGGQAVTDLAGSPVADVTAYRFKAVYVGGGVPPVTTTFNGLSWVSVDDPEAGGTVPGIQAPSLLGGEGLYRVFGQLRDGAGNASGAGDVFIDVVLDTLPPGAVVTVENTAGFVTDPSLDVRVVSSSSDPVVEMEIALDGGLFASSQVLPIGALDVTVPFDLSDLDSFAGDGEYTLVARLTDAAGNVAVKEVDVVLDTTPPEPRLITCSSCAAAGSTLYTDELEVLFDVLAEDDLGQVATVRVVVDGNTALPSSHTYDGTVAVQIPGTPSPEGPHTIAITFVDQAGNESALPTGADVVTVVYDSTIADPVLTIDGGAAFSTSPLGLVSLGISADADVTEMRIGNGGAFGPWQPFVSVVPWTLGQPSVEGSKQVSLEVRDAAGNVGADSATVQLDLAAPVGTAAIDQAPYATTSSVTVDLTHPSDVAEVALVNGPTADCDAVTYSTTTVTLGTTSTADVTHTLGAGDGLKYVTVCFKDQAGRTYDVTAEVTLDTAAPVGTVEIEDDAEFTQSATVDVYLTASTDIDEVALGDDTLNCAAVVTWESYESIKQVSLPGADGLKTVQVCFKDRAGLVSSAADVIWLDRSDPAGTALIEDGAPYTTTRIVNLTLDAPDDTVAYAVGDGTTLDCQTASYNAFADFVPYTLPAGDDTVSVTVCFEDASGRQGSDTDSIVLDTSAPAGTAAIAGGATYTTTLDVTVNLAHPADVDGYAVQAGLLDCALAAYTSRTPGATSTNVPFTFTPGDGTRTLSVCFRDEAGHTAGTSDDIIVDRTPPTGTVVVNDGAPYTTDLDVEVEYDVPADTAAYVIRTSVVDCFAPATVFDPYLASTETVTLPDVAGLHTLYACFEDDAGNVAEAQAQIRLDRTAPSITSVSINAGAARTSTTGVTVGIVYSDPQPVAPVVEMQVSEDATFAGAAWVPYSPSVSHVLSSENGTKTVYARVRDDAGNASSGTGTADEDTILLDTERPQITTLSHQPSSGQTIGYANTTTVALNVAADDNLDASAQLVAAIAVDDVTPCDAAVVPLEATLPATLPAADGDHIVGVCVRDQAQNTSTPAFVSIVYDDDAPNGVPPPTLVGGSRELSAAWIDTGDQGSAGIASWEVMIDTADTFTASPQSFSASTTSIVIPDVNNHVEYWVRVRARDRAGNLGAWSPGAPVLPGVSGVVTPGVYGLAGPDYTNPGLLYANGVLYGAIVDTQALGTGEARVQLTTCRISVDDCGHPDNWTRVTLHETLPAAESSVTTPRVPMVHFANRLWVAAVYRDTAGATGNAVVLHSCPDTAECTQSASWSMHEVRPANLSIRPDTIALGAGGTHLVVAFGQNNTDLRVAACAPNANDCDDTADFATAIVVDNGLASDDPMVEIAVSDGTIGVVYRRVANAVSLATCDQSTGCDFNAEWTTFSVRNPAGDPLGTKYSNPSVEIVDGYFYATWRRELNDAFEYRVSRCRSADVCTAQNQWSVGTTLSPVAGPFDHVHLGGGKKYLYATWWNGSFGATQLGICEVPSADAGPPGSAGGCTDPGRWRFLVVDDVVNLETEPAVVEVGPSPVVAYMAGLSIKMVLPAVGAPLEHAVVAGAMAVKQRWSPQFDHDGYEQVFGGTPPDWGETLALGDPSLSDATLAVPFDNDVPVSIRTVNDEGQVSEDALFFQVRPHRVATTDVEDAYFTNNRCLLGPSECAVAGSDTDGRWLVTAYAQAVGANGAVAVCDKSTADCTQPGSFSDVDLGALGSSLHGAQVRLVESGAGESWALALFHQGANARAFRCNLSTTRCDDVVDWSALPLLSNASLDLYPQITGLGGSLDEIYIAFRDQSTRVGIAECPLAGCASWTVTTTAAMSPGSSGLSVDAISGQVVVTSEMGGDLRIIRYQTATNVFSASSVVRPGLVPDFDQVRIAVGPSTQAIAAISFGRLLALTCPSAVTSCTSPASWAAVDLGAVPGNDGIGVDVAVDGTTVMVASVTGRQVQMSWCGSGDCGLGESWVKPVTAFRDQRLRPLSQNARFLTRLPGGLLSIGAARNAPSGVTQLLTLYDGKNEGPYLVP